MFFNIILAHKWIQGVLQFGPHLLSLLVKSSPFHVHPLSIPPLSKLHLPVILYSLDPWRWTQQGSWKGPMYYWKERGLEWQPLDTVVDGSGICRMTSIFFQPLWKRRDGCWPLHLGEGRTLLLGWHCPQPFLLLSFLLCVLEEEQLLWSGQGGKDSTTRFHWSPSLFRLQSEKGNSPSLTAFFHEKGELGTEDGNHSAHLWTSQNLLGANQRSPPLKTWETLANPPHFPVPPIPLQVCSTLSRTQRRFLAGKQNKRNYSWSFQISKLSRDLMYDMRIGQKSMQDESEWL